MIKTRLEPLATLPAFVAAHRVVAPLYTMEFINAPVTIERMGEASYFTIFYFRIEGFGYGHAEVYSPDPDTESLCSLVFDNLSLGNEIRWTQYYASKHGNSEIMALMRPILLEKLRPHLLPEIKGDFAK